MTPLPGATMPAEHRYGCPCSTCNPPTHYDTEPLVHETARVEHEHEHATTVARRVRSAHSTARRPSYPRLTD